MKSYEIERKYLVPPAPENLSSFPYHEIEQGYLSTEPVVRIRRQDEENYPVSYTHQTLPTKQVV